ncbi:MAG: tetratricopeptide repeat protein [Deltaproteobacteria bacterium]|nr:tetratricopeptide repeat protein [Deltaproteobacteria bacterium]
MKKFFLTVFGLLCFIPLGLHAEGPEELFEQANTAYYKNQLKNAEERYKQLIAGGISSGDLYYNLGNVYYRQGEFGEAIQNFEKALRLNPRDADVRANLKFVEQKRVDNLGETFASSFFRIFFFWYSYLTLKELILAFTLFSGLFWGLAWLNLLFHKSFFRWGAALFFVISLVIGSSTWFKYTVEGLQTWAVIVKPEVEVRSTYLESSGTLFKLHEGSKVRVIDYQKFGEKDAWALMRLPEGQKGWVRLEELGII